MTDPVEPDPLLHPDAHSGVRPDACAGRQRFEAIDELCINTLRVLAIDAVERANSGHPGTPMGAAPTAYCLWQRHLVFDPADPDWPNRDRFVLSAGHACALLYGLLHLGAVKATAPSYEGAGRLAVTLEDLENFRQAGSRCTGHPEYGWTSGVETTTGPLGQGAATSVGMAIAERWLAAKYNRPGYALFAYKVYALLSDGDMMEGVASEAASIAGHLKLANLCWIYDDNSVTIEGPTALAFSEDVGKRFEAYGWRVLHVADANDPAALCRAYETFARGGERPTLIVVKSHIGYGAPNKQDSEKAHGEALGADEARAAKRFYGFDPDRSFHVPDGVREHFAARFGQRGAAAHRAWDELFSRYRGEHAELARELDLMHSGALPNSKDGAKDGGWDGGLPSFPADAKGMATREASGKVLNAIAARVPWLLGGAGDLGSSTKTYLSGAGEFEAPGAAGNSAEHAAGDYGGRNLHYGIREHAMCAITSGLALAKLRPYAATFLIFSDYCRASIRLASMMGLATTYIFTHDSIGLGEDGPTHQPIEQLASLRAMPGMTVLRPADANEVSEAWRVIMQSKRPVCLVLTRQAVPTLDRTKYAPASRLARGAYVLADAGTGRPDILLIGTGSEVALCIAAYEELRAEGIKARVISMPSWELFERQSKVYRDRVLPPEVVPRVAVEAASRLGWERYVGCRGTVIGLDRFGLSAPAKAVAHHFGFEPAIVIAAAKKQLTLHSGRRRTRGGP